MNTIDDLRRADPAAELTDRPLDGRALADLRRAVTGPGPRRNRRRQLALAATACAVTAGVAVGVPAITDGGSTAYAVAQNQDGSVTIRIMRYQDAEGLEAEIEKYGVAAEVYYLPKGKWCKRPQYKAAPLNQDAAFEMVDRTGMNVVIQPRAFTPDRTLILTHSGTPDDPSDPVGDRPVTVNIATGPVGPCVPVDYPFSR